MKLVLFFCFISWSFFMQLCAQKKFTIVYESNICTTLDSLDKPIPITITSTVYSTLVINDSVSYCWPGFSPQRDNAIKSPLGSRFYWHSTYTNTKSRIAVDQAEPYGNPKYRIREAWGEINWEPLNGVKQILNYTCKKARWMNTKDSVIVWYTEELPPLFGPSVFRGLPGTILEFIYYGPVNINHTSAIKIKPEADKIVEPTDGKLISREFLMERIKRLQ